MCLKRVGKDKCEVRPPSVASPSMEAQEAVVTEAQTAHCALPFPRDAEEAGFGWVVAIPFCGPQPGLWVSLVWSSEPLHPRDWHHGTATILNLNLREDC
jgi:hypothetical protein